jgi:sensor histidine kinase YesM
MRFEHKFNFKINVQPSIQPFDIEIPPMLIQPYLENAVRHGLMNLGQPGEVSVEFEQFDNYLKCTIADNGVGRNKAFEVSSKRLKSHRSAGMEITQKRVDLLNRQREMGLKRGVEIVDLYNDNGEAAGTSVIILLPIKEL